MPLEAERRRTLLLAGGFLLLAVSLLVGALRLGLDPGLPLFLAGLLYLPAHLLVRGFKARVKRALLGPVAEALGFRYSPEGGFSREEALASGLFPSPDRYEAEDLVEGEAGGIPFASSDVALYRKVRTRNGSYYQRFFGGTLYRFRLPFPVEGEVRLAPQGKGKEVGWLTGWRLLLLYGFIAFFALFAALVPAENRDGPWWVIYAVLAFFALLPLLFWLRSQRGELKRVALESPEFERLFDAYGEDQVGARKLLTPAVQEALVRFRRYLGKPLWAAVKGDALWLAVEGRDRFEPSLFRPLTPGLVAALAHRARRELLEAGRVVEAFRLEEVKRKYRGLSLEG